MLKLISAPATNERGPRYMEKALAAIHQANHLRQPMSLEFGTQEGRVALFLRSLHKMEEFIVGPITANYPNCSITTVEQNEPCPSGWETWTAELDRQVLAVFDKMRIEDDGVRDWFRAVLASKTKDAQADTRAQRAELQRQETMIAAQQDRLLNLRINDQIDEAAFNRKQTEMRDRLASIMLQLDVQNRSHDENAEITSKVFELSQTLRQRCLTADYAEKRKILEIVWLNCRLIDGSLSPQIRKATTYLTHHAAS